MWKRPRDYLQHTHLWFLYHELLFRSANFRQRHNCDISVTGAKRNSTVKKSRSKRLNFQIFGVKTGKGITGNAPPPWVKTLRKFYFSKTFEALYLRYLLPENQPTYSKLLITHNRFSFLWPNSNWRSGWSILFRWKTGCACCCLNLGITFTVLRIIWKSHEWFVSQ